MVCTTPCLPESSNQKLLFLIGLAVIIAWQIGNAIEIGLRIQRISIVDLYYEKMG